MEVLFKDFRTLLVSYIILTVLEFCHRNGPRKQSGLSRDSGAKEQSVTTALLCKGHGEAVAGHVVPKYNGGL
jgi:hypothetical protein